MSRDVDSCSHWLRPRRPPSALGLYTGGAIGQLRRTISPCNPLGEGGDAVFGIRDILIRIRMRILLFSSVTLKCQQKIIFFSPKFLCIFLFEGTFTSFFEDKKSQRSHKTVEIKVFLHFFACWWRIRICTNKLRIRMRIQEAQKQTDLDPEHGGESFIKILVSFLYSINRAWDFVYRHTVYRDSWQSTLLLIQAFCSKFIMNYATRILELWALTSVVYLQSDPVGSETFSRIRIGEKIISEWIWKRTTLKTPGSRVKKIPDHGSGSASKNSSILTQKNWF